MQRHRLPISTERRKHLRSIYRRMAHANGVGGRPEMCLIRARSSDDGGGPHVDVRTPLCLW